MNRRQVTPRRDRSSRPRRHWLVRGAAFVLGLGLVGAPLTASAVDPSRGTPGFCPTEEGVTVVIDFGKLGGTAIVRCAPGPVGPGFTGHSALVDAGIQLQGTRRWGEAFICRLENRPAPDEVIPIKGREKYKEPCIDTPPAAGYWSYWWAANGGQWQYSQWGVKNRNAIRGGFEGWSFSLNATAETNPKPRITPRRPNSAPQPTNTIPTQGPSGNNPNEQQQPNNNPGNPGDQGSLPGDTITTIPGNSRPTYPSGSSGGPTQNGATNQPSWPGRPSTPGQPAPTSSNGVPQPGAPTTLPPGLPRDGLLPGGEQPGAPRPGDGDTPTPGSNGDIAWSGGEPSGSSQNVPKGVPVSTMLTGFAVLILLGGAVITAQYRQARRS
ncbi:ABC transporter substrate-binding protein [Kribbella sandramycini]|uniref:ABC transporter substrate-binding protein n=1 Tax=Kribbella sandramycini TaxID=60450 RepID=A0A7Y4KX09_9ACTN|nr:ABC transporter substrate-binding protein [Kribbella sandramycini]MBB6569931.1 hypothetical protein [Kribbella sandramycini]NOL40245.1 ABC transporter substrate-binding protein [Kribbella sandramycini]